MFALAACVLASGVLAPPYATAEATHGPEDVAGPPGLPNGRVYEQVSPANKYGGEVINYERPAFAAPSGQAVMYGASGAIIESANNNAVQSMFVSERTHHGWVTRSAMSLPVPGANNPEEYVGVGALPAVTVPSADLSHLLFSTNNDVPFVGAPDESELGNNVYLEGPDASAEPEWVGRSLIEGFPEGMTSGFTFLRPAGGSPDLKTIYFFYEGKLFPGASDLYEYKEGVLSDAGVLPGNETSTGIAAPAAEPADVAGHEEGLISAAAFDNQVSADGARIFFTRTDEAGTRELYARVTAPDGSQSTVLISRSQLPGHQGEPAPHGPLAVPSTEEEAHSYEVEYGGAESAPSYAFASSDGSHAFFQSTDRLTEAAPENGAAKTYDFDLDTGELEYTPGITGPIVTVSDDGSTAMFENTATSPFALEWWQAGPGGGSVTPIAQLPSVTRNACGTVLCVGPAFISNDSSVVVFNTESAIAGFNDGGTHYSFTQPLEGAEEPVIGEGRFPNKEVFRYDASGGQLSCLSCPPKGVTPSSDATMSKLDALYNARGIVGGAEVTTLGNAVSADTGRVFFETRDALVPQDTNGTLDVYEWEGGNVYLISSGHSPLPSYLTGVSETGGDAFFMTAEGIAPGDVDGSYDMYDARIPRPGDNPPPEAVPCSGSVCQGPPSVPQLLGAPASETFNGAGDLPPSPPASHTSPKSLTRAQKLARALSSCKHKKRARKRRQCEKQARRKYGAKAAEARREGKSAVHRNGRGK